MHYNNIKQSYLKNHNKHNAMMIIVYVVRKRSTLFLYYRTFSSDRISPMRKNSQLNVKLPTMSTNSNSSSKVDLN